MWPSNNAVIKTLSSTREVIFDNNGCLNLNKLYDFPKNLDIKLITSAIDKINTLLDQEEKLTLTRKLRGYINSCHHQVQLQSKKLNLWQNITQSFSSTHLLRLFVISLSIILPLSFSFPIISGGIMGGILIIQFILRPLSLWLLQRINCKRAEKENLKQKNKLEQLIEANNQTDQFVNPVLITPNEDKLFEIRLPKKLPSFKDLTSTELINNLTAIPGLEAAQEVFTTRHIGDNAPYEQKETLKSALELIYYRLNGELNSTLGPISSSEKAMIIEKLKEGVNVCTEGFHNRVNTILESFHQPQNFTELLYQVRRKLVETVANRLTNEVHANNRVTVIANAAGLGIRPNFSEDTYPGSIQDHIIQFALQTEFKTHYTLFNLPSLLADNLHGLLVEIGYTGVKIDGYSTGMKDRISDTVQRYLSEANLEKIFIIEHDKNIDEDDDFNSVIRDVNWETIKQCFFDQLLQKNYFTILPFDDFHNNLLPLLNYKDKQGSNYLMLFAEDQPESLKLLFYYLKEYPDKVTKETKEQLISLFFEKNKSGQNAIQIIAQHNPEPFIECLDFLNNHSEKNAIHWNNLIEISCDYRKIALAVINNIIKHPETFNLETSTSHPSLTQKNSAKFRRCLLSLMEINTPDSERINSLSKFISRYPKLLDKSPKKVAQFIFHSLTIVNDKELIDAIFKSHADLLLKHFPKNYFNQTIKQSEYILGKFLDAYYTELHTRKDHKILYTNAFRWGYSVHEKLEALRTLNGILENSLDHEKKYKLTSLKANYPALGNGRLSQFFKHCCHDDTNVEQIKIELHA